MRQLIFLLLAIVSVGAHANRFANVHTIAPFMYAPDNQAIAEGHIDTIEIVYDHVSWRKVLNDYETHHISVIVNISKVFFAGWKVNPNPNSTVLWDEFNALSQNTHT